MLEDLSWQYTEISWTFLAKPMRRHSRRIGQLTMQLTSSPATICHMGGLQYIGVDLSGVELNGVFSWFELSRAVFTKLREIRSRAQEAGSWIWTSRSHAIWMHQWVGIFWWWMICHPIMGLRWRVNRSRILWRSVTMTFGRLTELQPSRNAPHTSALTHIEETNGWKQLDCSQRRIAAGDGWKEIDRGRIWIATRYGWMTWDRSQEMHHGRQMAINPLLFMIILRLCEVIQFSRSRLWFRTTNFLWNGDMQV